MPMGLSRSPRTAVERSSGAPPAGNASAPAPCAADFAHAQAYQDLQQPRPRLPQRDVALRLQWLQVRGRAGWLARGGTRTTGDQAVGHIAKEDKAFFPAARAYFSDKEDQVLLARFQDFDRAMIHEKYALVVERLGRG
jgi:hypothetical protein